jgi:hypothetical protein
MPRDERTRAVYAEAGQDPPDRDEGPLRVVRRCTIVQIAVDEKEKERPHRGERCAPTNAHFTVTEATRKRQ